MWACRTAAALTATLNVMSGEWGGPAGSIELPLPACLAAATHSNPVSPRGLLRRGRGGRAGIPGEQLTRWRQQQGAREMRLDLWQVAATSQAQVTRPYRVSAHLPDWAGNSYNIAGVDTRAPAAMSIFVTGLHRPTRINFVINLYSNIDSSYWWQEHVYKTMGKIFFIVLKYYICNVDDNLI